MFRRKQANPDSRRPDITAGNFQLTSTIASGGETDTGRPVHLGFGPGAYAQPFPMEVLNGCEQRAPNRRPSQQDKDYSPWPYRRYTNMSVTDVQLNNGLHNGVAAGKRINYQGSGYLWNVSPIIPGQTRDNAGGFHRRGPSPYNVADVYSDGPGSQPLHPGGPGKIAAPVFINPMTG